MKRLSGLVSAGNVDLGAHAHPSFFPGEFGARHDQDDPFFLESVTKICSGLGVLCLSRHEVERRVEKTDSVRPSVRPSVTPKVKGIEEDLREEWRPRKSSAARTHSFPPLTVRKNEWHVVCI